LAFTPKPWRDGEAGGTPIDAAALADLERRIAGYTDETVDAIPPPTSADITDATTVGRSVLTASSEAVARTAIGAAPGAASLGVVVVTTGSEPRPTGHAQVVWVAPAGVTPAAMAAGDILARAAA